MLLAPSSSWPEQLPSTTPRPLFAVGFLSSSASELSCQLTSSQMMTFLPLGMLLDSFNGGRKGEELGKMRALEPRLSS